MKERIPWFPMAKSAVKLFPNDRPFTEFEALGSLQLNHNNGNMVSVRGLAKSWGWTHKKVRCFLPRVGVKIVYPQGTDKKQRGHIEKEYKQIEPNSPNFNEGHTQGHTWGTIMFIDFNKLDSDRGTLRAHPGAPINEKEKENTTLTSKTSTKDGVPHDQILDLYHAILSELPKVRVWTQKRKAMLRARWQEDAKRQKLDWWKGYFNHVRESKFLMGENGDFQANLEWLIRPGNLVKVIEGNYHR